VMDGFFDYYVCASDFLRDLVLKLYGIEAPVIPPFVHLDRIPAGPPWRERPSGRILVAAKFGGEALLGRFQQVMRRRHPSAAYSLEVVDGRPHDALLARMSELRYFLALSPREGFGLMPLEAMAAGCTVMGFHGGGGMHYMRAGENCQVVGYPAMDDLCERVAAVLGDDSAAERLAAAGRETAARYGLPAFQERWRARIGEFTGGRPGTLA
jgi:glycosyltransferase involved in cell wall biosynthesis